MPIKITIKKGRLRKIVRDAGLNYISAAKTVMSRKLISEMKKGRSPVRNGRWDKPYSESYRKQIRSGGVLTGIGKKTSPVNLKVSGQLHNSLKLIKRGFTLFMEFTDFLADIHNRRGAGKSKAIRRMLPTKNGEEFNSEIDKQLSKALVSSVRKAIKQNT